MRRRELSEEEMRAVTKVYTCARKIKQKEIDLETGKLTEHIARAMNTSSRTGSYRHAQMREDQYFQVADADPPPGANEDNDEENIFAEEHAEN